MSDNIAHNQPEWCCDACGKAFGCRYRTMGGLSRWTATYHVGTCGVCGDSQVSVTEPRDFGYLIQGWDEFRANQ